MSKPKRPISDAEYEQYAKGYADPANDRFVESAHAVGINAREDWAATQWRIDQMWDLLDDGDSELMDIACDAHTAMTLLCGDTWRAAEAIINFVRETRTAREGSEEGL